MTKYQEKALVRRAVKEHLKKEKGRTVDYNYRGVRYEKANYLIISQIILSILRHVGAPLRRCFSSKICQI